MNVPGLNYKMKKKHLTYETQNTEGAFNSEMYLVVGTQLRDV